MWEYMPTGVAFVTPVGFFFRPWGILAASALGSSRMPLEWWALGTAVLVVFFVMNKRYELKETLFGIINRTRVDNRNEKG